MPNRKPLGEPKPKEAKASAELSKPESFSDIAERIFAALRAFLGTGVTAIVVGIVAIIVLLVLSIIGQF